MRGAPTLVALALLVAACPALADPSGFVPIDLKTTPIDTFQVEPGGGVEYRGGLVLSSTARAFGSWSGLDFASDGTLYSMADDGQWLRLRLVEAGGRLTGVANAAMAPLLDDNGMPIRHKVQEDAEGLRVAVRNGTETAFVSLEQVPDVRMFAGPNFATARPQHLALPAWVKGLSPNLGLESIAIPPDGSPLAGAVLVIAEHDLDKTGNHEGYIIGGPRPGLFTLRRSDDLDVSDATFLANGDLLVLERKFDFPFGFSMRLVRIPAARVMAGALLDGPTVLSADPSEGIDNMEGLAVRSAPDGSAVIDLISDDNQSFLERTLLLQFALAAPVALVPRLRPDDAAIQ